MRRHALTAATLLFTTIVLPACARQSPPVTGGAAADTVAVGAGTTASTGAASSSASVATASDSGDAIAAKTSNSTAAVQLSPMVVHKSEFCGCCGVWVDHMREAGFQVEVRNTEDINPIKQQLGVPPGKGSCHTAEVGGYFIEGHVPAEDVMRLLMEKPDARGLAVPGMPAGSPGMEMPDGRVQPYTVELVGNDGSTSVFTRHGQ